MTNKRDLVEQYCADCYSNVHYSKRPFGFCPTSYFHKKLEKEFSGYSSISTVIEFGCGDFQHLPYIGHDYERYVGVDVLHPKTALDLEQIESLHENSMNKLEFLKCDLNDEQELVRKLGKRLQSFDRLLMTCLLHHLPNCWEFMDFLKCNMGQNAHIDIFLPHDPGVFHSAYQTLVSRPTCVASGGDGINFALVHAIEHQNAYKSIVVQLNHIFRDFRIRRRQYPFGCFVPETLNAFSIFHISR